MQPSAKVLIIADGGFAYVRDFLFRHLSAFNHTDKKLEHKYCCLRDRGGCGRMKHFQKFSLKLFIIGKVHTELASWNQGL